MSVSGSRPAYLDEFERKLATALAQQADLKKARLASIRSSDVDHSASSSPSLEEASSPSLEEALASSSPGRAAERPLNFWPLQPSTETREGRTPNRKAASVPVQYGAAAIAVAAATAPRAAGRGAVGASRPASELSQRRLFQSALKLSNVAAPPTEQVRRPRTLADASSADHPSHPARCMEEPIEVPAEMVGTAAVAAEVLQDFADAFARGGGNRLEGIGAVEAPLSEAARPIEAANLRAHETGVTDATKRGYRSRRFKALALAVSVAMVGAVFMRAGGMLAPASEAPGAAGPNLRLNMTPDQSAAYQAPRAEALAPSAASKTGSDLLNDRGAVYSAVAVPIAATPQAAETAPVQPAGGLPSGTSPASVVSLADAATNATQPPAQSFDIKPAPTVSPQPGPISDPISSAASPTQSLSGDRAPEPTAQQTRNEHDVGTPKPSASNLDAPIKVVGKPSTRAEITKNHATSHSVPVRAPSQLLPPGTPAKHDTSVKELKAAQAVVESATAVATPAATLLPGGLY